MLAATARFVDEAVYRLVLLMVGTGATFAVILVLYTIKSTLGIDLMDGPSFMHDFYLG